MSVLFSLFGIVALLGCAFLLSEGRSSINWKTVSRALMLQMGFAALVLYFPLGQAALASLSNGVAGLLSFADEGIKFLFGDLASSGFIFAIRVLPIIIFFSALISALYYLGIMQKVIQFIGGAIQKFLGTSKAESLVATGNIFLSQGESPLLIRPFLSNMTRSELFAVMVGGMATATLLTLFVIPAAFTIWKRIEIRRSNHSQDSGSKAGQNEPLNDLPLATPAE